MAKPSEVQARMVNEVILGAFADIGLVTEAHMPVTL
jgi:hypothetical protein